MNFKLVLSLGLLSLNILSCSPENPKAYVKPAAVKNMVQHGSEVFDPMVDILFVVDNSQSMESHQKNLSDNVDKFTSTFVSSSVLDYHIGVITTDMSATSLSGKPCCGRLVGNVRVVSKSTLQGDQVLANNLRVGTNGSYDEKVFEPVFAALSLPEITGHNAGFYRPDATLVVVFLTDAEDQSRRINAQELYKFLVGLKRGNRDKVLAYGVIVPSNDTTGCPRDAGLDRPARIEAFLSLTVNNPGNVMHICDPDYGVRLATMAKDIVNKVGSTIYLESPPNLKSIRVTYGSEELPQDYERGWSFDIEKNAIVLGSKIDWASQPVGSRVRVTYKVATFE